MKQLYPKQESHKKHLLSVLQQHRSGIDSSATGTGKTIIGADIAKDMALPTLVIGLKSTLKWWETTLKDQGVKNFDVINYEKLRMGKSRYGGWAVTGAWTSKMPTDSLIIWDECQRCQGLTTLNAKMMLGSKAHYNLLCSATAAENPAEMRASGYILGLHNLRDFWAWAKARGCVPNQWGKLEFYGKKEIIQKLHDDIFPEHGSRLTVADLSDHFTETQIITTPLVFGKQVEDIYKQMEEEIRDLENRCLRDSKHPEAQILIAQLRARQKVELLKVPLIVEMTNDLVDEGMSVVVFFNYDASIEAFKKHYPLDIKIIRGGQSSSERQDAIDSFQNDLVRCCVCNLQAGGVSVNLHDINGNFPRASILSPSFNPKDVLQAIGRVHRFGGKTPTQQHILFAANTIEEKVEQAVRAGIENIGIFNDGMQNSLASAQQN